MILPLLPRPLQPGQCVRVVAPSGVLREWERFEAGVALWRDRGYDVRLPEPLQCPQGYLAADDASRRQQLYEALCDPECAAILCARGGYGAIRLLEDWIWPPAAPRKWLVGFSDITALLWSQLACTGSVGLLAPVLTTLDEEPDWSLARMFDWLEGRADRLALTGVGWGGGKAEGILLPGNLTVATFLLGTPHCPPLEGAILAFEDVGEPPYRLDRLLTHWRLTGALRGVKGIALGRFSQSETSRPTWTVSETLRDRLSDLGIPIVSELPFGHDGANAALPVGGWARLDGDRGSLECGQSRELG